MKPTNDSYQDYLISHLKDPAYAGIYLETHFEEDGDSVEPELLKLALSQVLEALSRSRMTDEQVESHLQAIDEILSKPGNQAILALASWLDALGLKLTVVPNVQETTL